MLYSHDVVSDKPWEPIFDIRTRPVWVQVVAFDLFKQLTPLRNMPITLPSIDTLSLPLDGQTRVNFGDLLALCDAIELILNEYGPLGVAYGGPDDKGTLWMKFYKMLADDRTWGDHLQFIIWIDSRRPSILTLEESTNLFHAPTVSQTRPREIRGGQIARP